MLGANGYFMKLSHSFAIGRRVAVAAFATAVLVASLVSVKVEKAEVETLLRVESREEPNILLGAIAIYLLGVATDFDLTMPFKMLQGGGREQEKRIYTAEEFMETRENRD